MGRGLRSLSAALTAEPNVKTVLTTTGKDTTMANCPECDAEFAVDEQHVRAGEMIVCPACGSRLEVVDIAPAGDTDFGDQAIMADQFDDFHGRAAWPGPSADDAEPADFEDSVGELGEDEADDGQDD